jgi:N-acetylmuramoyl-L-alanine amidase
MKYIRIISTIIFLVLISSVGTYAAETVDVYVSGSTEKINATVEESVPYISFSQLVEILGGMLDWDLVGHRISYVRENNHLEFTVDSPYFKLNDTVYNLTFPVKLTDGQLYLPPTTFIPFLNRVSPQQITYSEQSGNIRIESEYFNVTDIAFSRKANGLLVEIYLTTTLAYDIFLTEGNWINVSIRDAKLNQSKILSRKDSRFMYRLKTHQIGETGQVSFRLKRNVEKWHHKIVYDPPRIQISIADAAFNLDTADTAPVIGPDNKIDVIVIDPGHGGGDYGAIGKGGTREKDVALGISKELAKLIRKDKQFKVIMTRDRDKTLTLQQRANVANKAAADLFISIHANSSLKKNVRGWNVFFLAQAKNDSARAVAQFENSAFLKDQRIADSDPSAGSISYGEDPILGILNEMIMTEFQAESHDFAMMADREMRRAVDIPARGVDQAGFYVLNMVFSPSVLVESGFISNKNEEKLLKSSKYQKKVAKAIYEAIKRFRSKYESN